MEIDFPLHHNLYYGMTFGRGSMEQIKIAELPKEIGPYSIVQSLGRGGMGEVFLAKDPSCGRQVALKRIRPELRSNKTIQSRFLREARVASVLSHPSIVPILAIQTTPPDVYYTMPFVEGETLRQILRSAREEEKEGAIPKSIPALTRIFLQVCEAVAYTHSKGIIHRDLKPENIIVGKYGEVMILDWGIADFLDQLEKEKPTHVKKLPGKETDLTRPGKITGTLAYMAPERLTGGVSSVQTDIYALGVILYQILTLQLPFQRKTIAAFRKTVDREELIDPVEMAPYRDIPHQLSAVCHRCLAKSASDRYKSVEELIGGLKGYIEGKAEWVFTAALDQNKKEHWQFQENILLAKHIAITQSLDVTEWAALMISKGAFAENIRIEAEVCFGESSQGLGFLLSVPEERENPEEGYCLWIGSEKNRSTRLFRNNVQVMEAKAVHLQPKTWHQIRIEKVDDQLRFYLDGRLKLKFASHLPLAGNHIGLLHKDGDFSMKNWKIYDGSHNVMVGCLAVPNAFLSHKIYDVALQEYRRIGRCFPGRMEGREALFRAGLTLIEKARVEKTKPAQEKQFHLALKEFEKLYRTPGAPLEYLGKSLVYEGLGDAEEEAKCLELTLRKFPKHPLLPIVKEHIVYRMHESSLNNREAAYQIILLAIRHIPDLLDNSDTQHLIDSLEKNWEPLSFLQESSEQLKQIAIQLAFWLAKVPILVEIAKTVKTSETLFQNALFSLLELECHEELQEFPSPLSTDFRSIRYKLRQALQKGDMELFDRLVKKFSFPNSAEYDALKIWGALLRKNLSAAAEIFGKYPESALTQETSPLHFPYGTWLYLSKGKETAMRHFSAVLELPHPTTSALPSYFLTNRISAKHKFFWWEKKELYRQIDLFYKCVGKKNETKS